MDIPRSDHGRRRRTFTYLGIAIGVVILVTLGISHLEPAAPSVDRASLWIDSVRRGPMVREVRGLGTLVPEEVRWIPAASEGRVEKVLVQPGATVKADTVLVELSNSELELQAQDALSQLRGAEAQLAELKARLESQRLDEEMSAARAESDFRRAKLQADTDGQLAREGLVAALTAQLSKVNAEEAERRYKLEQQRVEVSRESVKAQLAMQQAQVDQRRASAELRRSQVEGLRVRAGIAGVLQQLPVEVGQRIAPGATLAKVAAPDHLKAVVRVAEAQAKDLQVGQTASIDTRNGLVKGHVARIDPAAQSGTVAVDLTLDEALPKGARPDLTVDGTIELERLENVLYLGRPSSGQPGSVVSLFKLDRDGRTAVRAKVKLGRASVSVIEVVEGLSEGEQAILSDTSTWDRFDRLRLN
jgi:HlyD family secretion protein